MDDFKPELSKALLDWVNTFDLPRRISSWNQLEDGQILWQILADADPEYFDGPLPETDRKTTENWISRWQNLKHIDRAVTTYIRDECGKLPVLSKKMTPDLKVVAQDGSPMLTAKLAMMVLLVAFYSERSNQRMIEIMGLLGPKTSATIATAIQDLEDLDQRMADLGVDQEFSSEPDISDLGPPPKGPPIERDPDLEREAQLIEANRKVNQLNSRISTLTADLEQSRRKISTLEEELVEFRLMLDGRGAKQVDVDDAEHLRAEAMRDRQYIAELESDLANAKAIVSNQERQLERLKADADTKQDLRDELQLVRAERDELSQKAKANENLHKKIRTMNEQARANETLRQDLQSAQEQIQEFQSYKDRCAALEKANKENVQTIANGEQSLFEEKGRRARVEHENHLLLKQLEQARELQSRAEDWRKELEDRVRDLESSGHAARGGSLEDELAGNDTTEIADEPTKATNDGTITSETIVLQQQVEILSSRLRSIEQQYLDLLQENLGLKSDMKDSNVDEKNQRPFLEQSEKLQATEAELLEVQRQLREKDLENAELRNDLSKKSSDTDVAEDRPEVQALRTSHEHLLAAHDALQKHNKGLELSLDEKTSLLRTALIDRNRFPSELIELRSTELLKHITEQIESVTATNLEDQPKAVEVAAADITERLQSGQIELESVKKELDSQKAQNESLKLDLERARVGGIKQASDELQKEVENLRRENRLITSAWYDITSRLQSNTVVLQRKSEAPKSWLGRQRAVVGAGAGASRR
ncbi:hypothetical protein K432DRAFT_382466 [Lepidopterella palustris CBS 459.81]|uniref:HOOK N-terminal domain-containing protein n=1 Tax=Lepidopterella palustris CBS 459.81 TaxID=1314670 RepID=A0A8E2EA96_9PEZI|nr:hypothetical protein K432DRAFT_382466 [Lepidopterella palustris CBS 459.81]